VIAPPSRDVGKDAVASDAVANRNQNDPANEALAALVGAMVARGDMAGAARVLAAYEPRPVPRELPPEVGDLDAARKARR
jgi:hypothetical protein